MKLNSSPLQQCSIIKKRRFGVSIVSYSWMMCGWRTTFKMCISLLTRSTSFTSVILLLSRILIATWKLWQLSVRVSAATPTQSLLSGLCVHAHLLWPFQRCLNQVSLWCDTTLFEIPFAVAVPSLFIYTPFRLIYWFYVLLELFLFDSLEFLYTNSNCKFYFMDLVEHKFLRIFPSMEIMLKNISHALYS